MTPTCSRHLKHTTDEKCKNMPLHMRVCHTFSAASAAASSRKRSFSFVSTEMLVSARASVRMTEVLPDMVWPTIMTPWRTPTVSCSCRHLVTNGPVGCSPDRLHIATTATSTPL